MTENLFVSDFDKTQRKSSIISLVLTIVFWIMISVVLAVSPSFQKKEKYKTIKITLAPMEQPTTTSKSQEESAAAAPAPAEEQSVQEMQAPAKPVEEAPKPVEKTEQKTQTQQKPAEAPKPVEKPVQKTEPVTKPAAEKPAPAPAKTETPAASTSETYKKAEIKYKKSNEELMEEQENKSSVKDFDWSQLDDDSSVVTNSSSAPVQSQKALTGSDALGGSAAEAASSSSSPVKSTSQSTSTQNQSVSSSTTSALSNLASIKPYADPFLAGTGLSSTAKIASNSSNGKVSIQMSDGTSRILLEPSKPVIYLSDESAALIDSSRTVNITFTILADGSIPSNSINFTPSAALPGPVQSDIRIQISKWRFASADGVGKATFEYSIIRK